MESTSFDFSAINALLNFLTYSLVVPPPKFSKKCTYNLLLIKEILVDPPQELFQDDLLEVCESVVEKVGSIVSSFDLNKMNQYTGHKLCQQLRKYLKSEKRIPDAKRFMDRPMPSPSYYPTTSRFIFINHLLENLEELLEDTDSSTVPFNYAILKVQTELRFWYSDLVEISSNPPLFLKEVIETITRLAYNIEYALDSFLVGNVPSWHCILWLYDILKEFEKIEHSDGPDGGDHDEEDLKEKKEIVQDMLLGGDKRLDIITIHKEINDMINGPSEEKNKAFAKELYNSPSAINHFDFRACCHLELLDVARDARRRPLLELLGELVDLSDIIRSKNYKELSTLIYECLKGKRFLVVVDNVQMLHDWDDILRWFPDSHNGSRIVFITPTKEFAFNDKFKSIVQPQFPQDDKIWELLSCPSEMLEVGMRISKRCKPESRIWVAHLLKTIHKVGQWEEVAKTLGSRVFGLQGTQLNRILNLTCTFLPHHLRACFFYMGLFLYREVLVSKLIRLWIAEGFVKLTAFQSLENTAEDYVADLIARNLLVPTEEKTLGRAKTCSLDPVLIDFLSIKVSEDNFLQRSYSEDPKESDEYKRRILIHFTWNKFVMSKPFGRAVHSLFYYNYESNYSRDISFIFNNFKFLRILKLQGIVIGDSFIEFGILVLLRYLEVESSMNIVPSSISNIWNLETFLFEQRNDEVVKVPDCIWDMTKLRHFHIQSYTSFLLEPHRLEDSSSILNNLQSLSKPTLSHGDDMGKILRRLPALQKLFCVFLDSWDYDTKCNRFPMLGFLNQLISLKVHYNGAVMYPCEFNFPSNLKKLTLVGFKMPWNEISQLAKLNNLEVLKLAKDAFEGERWEMEYNVVFQNLKHLQLKNLDIVEWKEACNHFPNLEHLVFLGCSELLEIPQDFAYISSLRMIKVIYSTLSVENSVKLIQEQHVKCWGHDELKIYCTNNE